MTNLRLMLYAVGVLDLIAPGPAFAGASASQQLERLAFSTHATHAVVAAVAAEQCLRTAIAAYNAMGGRQ